MDFSRTGKHIVLGGAKGHLAMFNWERNKLNCEIFVKENIHDVHFLHNETMFAVAQKKYVYVRPAPTPLNLFSRHV
jgi:U3 small nucleolar RNA-associated protein 7